MEEKINLHVHSTISDGKKTPDEIVDMMEKNNVLFSLTDHDNISGNFIVTNLIQNKKLFITGCEFTSSVTRDFPINFEIHLLAYDFNLNEIKPHFIERDKLIQNDLDHVKKLLKQEKNYDYCKTFTELNDELSVDYSKTKANSMIRELRTLKELCAKEVIDLVHGCGGMVFLAHPYNVLHNKSKMKISEKEIENLIQFLITIGLDGIESHYYNYNNEQVEFLSDISKKYNLLQSSGVDNHFKNDGEPFYQKNKKIFSWLNKED
ncbi:MAG: hypothetical protein R3Y05_03745 [bacterium]